MTSISHTSQQVSPSTKGTIGYRADIDGLRAVAVLLVVFYHLGIRTFSGGFVGVDIFFVISGYLIGAIILSEVQQEKFSILRFYERRVRRIGPALLVLMLGTATLAYFFLLPSEMKEFAISLVCAAFSAANIFFWYRAGYFDSSAESQPLLHTWSLAVEEQFYLLFPLLVLAISKFAKRKLKITIVVLSVLSLGLGAFQAFASPKSAFFLPLGRAWELLLGVLIYLRIFPSLDKPWQRNLASSLGAILIVLSGVLYSPKTPFPGLTALMPCIGAALIIAAGERGSSFIGGALSLKPMVGIGLISYSLYLWHWPILVFQRLGATLVDGASVRTLQVTALTLSLIVGYASWRWVETPFRTKYRSVPRFKLFSFAGASVLFIAAIAAGIMHANGFPSRFPAEAVRVGQFLEYDSNEVYRTGSCFITTGNTLAEFDWSKCLKPASNEHNILILGDSHAAQLWIGLSKTYPNVNFMQATASGCKPTLRQPPRSNSNCSELMKSLYTRFLSTQHVDAVFVAARWEDSDIDRVRETLLWAKEHGLHVVLFGPMLQYDTSLPRLLARSIQSGNPNVPGEHRVAEFERLDDEMDRMSTELNVPYVSFFKILCPNSHCIEYAKNTPLQSDRSHLTGEGSILFAALLRRNEPGNILQ